MNWAKFFDMGGYAFFVWTSYGLTFVLLVANVVSPILQRKKVIARVKRAIKREAMVVENQAVENRADKNRVMENQATGNRAAENKTP